MIPPDTSPPRLLGQKIRYEPLLRNKSFWLRYYDATESFNMLKKEFIFHLSLSHLSCHQLMELLFLDFEPCRLCSNHPCLHVIQQDSLHLLHLHNSKCLSLPICCNSDVTDFCADRCCVIFHWIISGVRISTNRSPTMLSHDFDCTEVLSTIRANTFFKTSPLTTEFSTSYRIFNGNLR